MKYPILYAKNETDFFSLGLGVMTNTLEASVTEERNGSFYFESKIIIDVVIYPQLENDQLIKVDAGHELKDQRFRIKRIVDNHNGTASIYAEHISYLSAELSLKPEVTVSGNGSTALTIWKSSLIGANSFVVDSDITTSNSAKWRIDKVQNARQALGGVEGSILEKWGGEYRFDNYHISLLSKRGTTADVLLAYGRNITDFEQERNIANTFNSVYPFAIYTDDKQQEHLITLSDSFVDSANIASFPNRKAQTVDFSNEFEHDVVPSQDKLKSLAQKYITTNGIGVPSVSIKVSFVDISKISDYENIAPLEQLNLCDEVHVVYPKLKVNTTAKVVRVVWNVLAESYDEIEIGEKRVSLSDKISEQTKFINEVKTGVNAALVSANGKNTNFYGLFGEDGKGEPKATKVGDLWYKPNGEETEMYQWNGTIWEFVMSTAPNPEIVKALEQAQKEVEEAKTAAQDAVDKANASVAAVQANTQLINDVNVIANNAKSQAQTAATNAQTALTNANTAKTNAQTALDKANGVSSKVTTIETTIDTINGTLSSKANTTDLNALKGRVSTAESSITQNANDILQKASKTDVNTLTGRVTSAEGSISTMAGQIALKANQADVNTITGKVSSLESSFTIQSGQISALNTKTDGHTTQIGSLQSSYSGLQSTISVVQSNLENMSNRNLALNSALENSAEYFNYVSTNVDFVINPDSNLKYARIKATNASSSSRNFFSTSVRKLGDCGLIAGDYITWSAMFESCQITGSVTEAFLRFYDINGNIISTSANVKLVSKSGYSRLGNSTQIPSGAVTFNWALVLSDVNDVVRLNHLMINKGRITLEWLSASEDSATVTSLSEFKQDVNNFKTTVANTYADKTTVASQINQSAIEVRQDIQSWTNGQLTNYSTIQSTNSSIALAVADKVTQTQFTILNNQLTSVITQRQALQSNLLQNAGLKNNWDYWTDVTPGTWTLSIHPNFRWAGLRKSADLSARHMTIDFISSVTLNQTLTFVIRCKSNSSKNVYVQLQTGKGQSSGYSFMVPVTASMATYKVEIATSGGASATNIAFSSSDFALNDTLEIEYMKLVRGSTDDLAYYPASSDSASQSQITQLSTLINLRVKEGDVLSQINIEAGRTLIDTKLLLLSADTVKFTGSAFIPNAMIQSITADKINTGILNAADVNIINLDVNNLTGNLTNFVRTYWTSAFGNQVEITGNAITLSTTNGGAATLTSNQLAFTSSGFANGGVRLLLANWRDINDSITSATGAYIGASKSSTDYLAFTRSNGTTFMLRAENSMNYGANTNVIKNALNIYDPLHIWQTTTVHGNTNIDGYLSLYGISESSIQYSTSAGTMNFRVPGGRSGSYFWFNNKITCADGFASSSLLSLKNIKGNYESNALAEICKTEIVEYSYKNRPQSRQISPIIDDVNEFKQYYVPEILVEDGAINIYAMNSMAWLAIKQLNKKIEELERKIA